VEVIDPGERYGDLSTSEIIYYNRQMDERMEIETEGRRIHVIPCYAWLTRNDQLF